MTETNNTYDYIIVGAGAAGLMLAKAMSGDPFFDNSRILLLDKDQKNVNDRTWCFWEKGNGPFDPLVSHQWNQINFTGKGFSKDFDIHPYVYKMVRGVDFYQESLRILAKKKNIEFRLEEVKSIKEEKDHAIVQTDQRRYQGKKVFNSIFTYGLVNDQTKYPVLQQHFLGWKIRTDPPVFNPGIATYMDFSIPQKGNTRFMYVLPFSEKEALVEYTLFSKELLPKEEYEQALKEYLGSHLGVKEYNIVETETGSIPMTCYDFTKNNSRHIFHIGTVGGWAKPSTGYAFMSTAKKIPFLINQLKLGNPLDRLSFKNRFWYYDLLLLDVLDQNNDQGHMIFQSIFQKRKPQLLFKFLDEKTSLSQELFFIWACPKYQFIKVLLKRALN